LELNGMKNSGLTFRKSACLTATSSNFNTYAALIGAISAGAFSVIGDKQKRVNISTLKTPAIAHIFSPVARYV